MGIRIEHVVKRYGSFLAVNDISLEVQPGEIFGFLGVNGAGKTTTLRMLAGILRPTSGRIILGDYDLLEAPNQAKSITGYIPDRPYLYNRLTGREFLYFCADIYRVPRDITDQRVPDLLNSYSLLDWQDELIESYSHGMKQRLATCAALIHNPSILIIDEPMVGLDPHGAKLLKASLRRYAQEGKAIMLSTHSLHVAEELVDKLAIIHKGSIITSGTLAEVKAQSSSTAGDLESIFIELTANQDAPP